MNIFRGGKDAPLSKIFVAAAATAVAAWAGYKTARLMQWQRSLRARFPGPRPLLYLGNALSLWRARGFNETFFKQLHEAHGKVAGFFLGPRFNVSVADPELMMAVYRRCPARPLETRMLLNFLGEDNLLFQHGPMVQPMRAKIAEWVATESQLTRVHAVSVEQFSAAAADWAKSGAAIDVHKAVARLLYEVPARVIFNRPFLGTPDGDAIHDVHMELIRTVETWMFFDPLPDQAKAVAARLLPGFARYRRCSAELRARCAAMLAARRSAVEEQPAAWATDDSALTMLVASKDTDGKPFFSESLAISTMIGLLHAAYDTTATTLTWLVYHLAANPEVQRKLREEISAALGGRRTVEPGMADADVLRRLPYLAAVMQESIRLRAPVLLLGRVNLDHHVRIGPYVLPRRTNVHIPIGVMFRDEAVFGRDTNRFLPERFLDSGEGARRARASLMIFGGGSRVCSGLLFAHYELKAAVAAMVLGYDFALDDPRHAGSYRLEAGVHRPLHNRPILVKFKATKVHASTGLPFCADHAAKGRG